MTDGPQRPVPGPPLAVRPTRASATPRCRSNRSSLGSPSWTASRRLTTGVLEAVHDALVAELARAED